MSILVLIIISILGGIYSLTIALGNWSRDSSMIAVTKKQLEETRARESEWLDNYACLIKKKGNQLYYKNQPIYYGQSQYTKEHCFVNMYGTKVLPAITPILWLNYKEDATIMIRNGIQKKCAVCGYTSTWNTDHCMKCGRKVYDCIEED